MTRAILILLAAVAAWLAVDHWRDSLIADGDARGAARVQSAWDNEKTRQAQALVEAQQQASSDQLRRFRNAERIADEQTRREAAYQTRLAGAAAANRSLLDTIAQLNAQLTDLSAPGADPRLAALAREATEARELLGTCSSRYLAVAADAHALRDQVIGLQDFVRGVLPTVTTQGETDGL